MSVLNKQTAQRLNKKKQVFNIHENENSDAEKKQWAKGNYASKSEKRKPRYETQWWKNSEWKLQLPSIRKEKIIIHLQERVKKRIELINQKHVVKLDKFSDKQYISPIIKSINSKNRRKLSITKHWATT